MHAQTLCQSLKKEQWEIWWVSEETRALLCTPTTADHTPLYHTTLHYTTLHYTTLHCQILHNYTPLYTTPHYPILHHTAPYHTTIHTTHMWCQQQSSLCGLTGDLSPWEPRIVAQGRRVEQLVQACEPRGFYDVAVITRLPHYVGILHSGERWLRDGHVIEGNDGKLSERWTWRERREIPLLIKHHRSHWRW